MVLSFETFIGAYHMIWHLTRDPSDVKDATYEDWFTDDCTVISWLGNRVEENVSWGVMMLKSAKKIWDTLKSTYRHEKNIFKICEIY